jgi:sensor histidine kinase regulating citrate/malate metabolism
MTICIWKKFNLGHVPHSLEADQKRSPVELSRELLQMFEQDQEHEFEHKLTGDESWFFFNIFIIRAGPQIQMACLKFRNKNSIRKVPHFDYLG